MRSATRVVLFTTVAVAIFSLRLATSSYANVVCPKAERIDLESPIFLTGEITMNDANAIRECFENKKSSPRLGYVLVDSEGGDVYAAMDVGRTLRKHRAVVRIQKSKKCISSCVLVLAGAVDREPWGEIGIHRPFSTRTGVVAFGSAQDNYQKIRLELESYLREMNIPSTLFAAMERVPPEEVQFLSKDETASYGLYSTDPVEQEVHDADDADRRGISKQDYYRRIAEAKQMCPPWPKDDNQAEIEKRFNCRQAVTWGLSPSEYERRRGRVMTACKDIFKSSGEEAWRSCVRDVMQGKK